VLVREGQLEMWRDCRLVHWESWWQIVGVIAGEEVIENSCRLEEECAMR